MLLEELQKDKSQVSNQRKIVQTDDGAMDGQTKCPKCGATDISTNLKNGKLRCNYCRFEFELEKVVGLEENIGDLKGEVIASGIQDIVSNTNDIITFKCSSCGAEVVVDTSETTQARCHWCRNMLSINQQIPNGSIPDMVLPFKLSKNDAKKEIENFVSERSFFAHPKFKSEFTTDNIMGVYFPYVIVDINSKASLDGFGEKEIRRYTVGANNNRKTLYDADLYAVKRKFDLVIEGLTIESSKDKLNKTDTTKTNNVINAIMPFDIENAVKWNSNYLRGYTSEKRDTNIDEIRPLVNKQSKDIARFSINNTLKFYDRGVRWANEQLSIEGIQWKSAYLPVWLYSYKQDKGNNSVLHYVAVNARTKETMGSVPIHMPKLFFISALIEALGILLMYLSKDFEYRFIFLLFGIMFFCIMYFRYRNSSARHHHETETKNEISNIEKEDTFIKHENGLSNAKIHGANNKTVSG